MIATIRGGVLNDPTMYDGRDLTQIFATEIASFPSPWHWIQNRINNRNYKGLNHGDFIPMTINGEILDMQININTYKKTTNQKLDDHIDFISRDCYSQTVQWNANNTNNGTAEQPCPYLASDVKQFLDQLYEQLPVTVKSLIVTKTTMLEYRYSNSGVLTDDNGQNWVNLGNLWLLSEYEVFGNVIWGTKGWSAGQAIQYPIFVNSWKNRLKGNNDWCLLSVAGDSSNLVCYVTSNGYTRRDKVTQYYHVPICFRFIRQSQS